MNKISCLIVFLGGMAISMVAVAFIMNMPQQMFQMGSQMFIPQQQQQQPQACNCKCN
jgi:hypothetical protein